MKNIHRASTPLIAGCQRRRLARQRASATPGATRGSARPGQAGAPQRGQRPGLPLGGRTRPTPGKIARGPCWSGRRRPYQPPPRSPAKPWPSRAVQRSANRKSSIQKVFGMLGRASTAGRWGWDEARSPGCTDSSPAPCCGSGPARPGQPGGAARARLGRGAKPNPHSPESLSGGR